jgi:hypothetical protein
LVVKVIQVETTHIWLALIAIAPILITSLTAAILALRGAKHDSQMMDIAKDTKQLVNGGTSAMLEGYSVLARRMAEYTKMPEDFAIADNLEAKYKHHLDQQLLVHEQQETRDAGSGP